MAKQTYPSHNEVVPRLRRIEGQVRGVARMVEEKRYCLDIIQQMMAVRRALDETSLKIIQGHINGCVSQAIRNQEGSEKIKELVETLRQFVK